MTDAKAADPAGSCAGPDIIYYSASDRMAGIVLAGLLQCGYRAVYANSPYLAIIKAAQFLPKLVVVDINNANTKGFSILGALRKSPRTRGIRVLLMLPAAPMDLLDSLKKTYGDLQTEKDPSDMPVLRYPFSFSELVSKIEHLLHP